MVEFAVVAPVFFLFVFGLVEIGRGMMVSSLLHNAARAGCRAGIVPGNSNTAVNAAVDGLLQNQGITGYTTTISVKGQSADVSTGQTADTIQISISVSAAATSWIPNLSFLKNTITAQYSLPHE